MKIVKFDIEKEEPVRGPDGFCIPCEPGETGEVGPLSDLQMIVACSGGQRTRRELDALLARAGFRLERVTPTATLTHVAEAVAV